MIWANFVIFVGCVTLARAVDDKNISNEIALSIEKSIYDCIKE